MLENVEGYAGNEVGEFIQVVGKTVLVARESPQAPGPSVKV